MVADEIKQETTRENKKEDIAKYTIKDSVFTDLFQNKKYLIQLYKALHPEDNTATEDELTDITIMAEPRQQSQKQSVFVRTEIF